MQTRGARGAAAQSWRGAAHLERFLGTDGLDAAVRVGWRGVWLGGERGWLLLARCPRPRVQRVGLGGGITSGGAVHVPEEPLTECLSGEGVLSSRTAAVPTWGCRHRGTREQHAVAAAMPLTYDSFKIRTCCTRLAALRRSASSALACSRESSELL
eukprot:6183763-Pleurochrysis_carterae.AAC.1